MTVKTFPVWTSGRSNSSRVPRETMISCCRAPEKFPTIACVIAVGCCKVRLYRCIVAKEHHQGRRGERREEEVLGGESNFKVKSSSHCRQDFIALLWRSCHVPRASAHWRRRVRLGILPATAFVSSCRVYSNRNVHGDLSRSSADCQTGRLSKVSSSLFDHPIIHLACKSSSESYASGTVLLTTHLSSSRSVTSR